MTTVAAVLALAIASSAVSAGKQFPVLSGVFPVPDNAMALMTGGDRGREPQDSEVRLVWAPNPDYGRWVRVVLAMRPIAGYDQGAGRVSVIAEAQGEARLRVDGRETVWTIRQANFGSSFGQVHYRPDGRTLTFVVPVLFSRVGDDSEQVHAFVVAPCRIERSGVGCDAPRLAFRQITRLAFPDEQDASVVLPLWEGSSVSAMPLQPPSDNAPCCSDAYFSKCDCSPSVCPMEGGWSAACRFCTEGDCLNCTLMSCWGQSCS